MAEHNIRDGCPFLVGGCNQSLKSTCVTVAVVVDNSALMGKLLEILGLARSRQANHDIQPRLLGIRLVMPKEGGVLRRCHLDPPRGWEVAPVLSRLLLNRTTLLVVTVLHGGRTVMVERQLQALCLDTSLVHPRVVVAVLDEGPLEVLIELAHPVEAFAPDQVAREVWVWTLLVWVGWQIAHMHGAVVFRALHLDALRIALAHTGHEQPAISH